jgi:hypothetical protein
VSILCVSWHKLELRELRFLQIHLFINRIGQGKMLSEHNPASTDINNDVQQAGLNNSILEFQNTVLLIAK